VSIIPPLLHFHVLYVAIKSAHNYQQDGRANS
jgi:hypothetical protein